MTTLEVETILEKIRELESEISQSAQKRDESISFHEKKIFLAKHIFEVETYEIRQEIARLSYALECYYKENPPKRNKSIKFSGGTIGYHKQEPKYYFGNEEIKTDNPTLVAFLKANHDEYIKIKEYVDWSKLKKALSADDNGVYFKETGEILDGFRAELIPEKFTVKAS